MNWQYRIIINTLISLLLVTSCAQVPSVSPTDMVASPSQTGLPTGSAQAETSTPTPTPHPPSLSKIPEQIFSAQGGSIILVLDQFVSNGDNAISQLSWSTQGS